MSPYNAVTSPTLNHKWPVEWYKEGIAGTARVPQSNYNSNGWAAYPPSGTQTSTNPVTRLFVYTADEPASNCSAWNSGTTRHAYATPAYMPELVTGTLTQATACGSLQNVDILVANLKLTQSPLNPTIEPQQPYFDWIAGTNPTNPHGQHREYWSYQACDQTGTCGNGQTGNSTWTMPNVNIDGLPVTNRADEWFTFRQKQTGELYFEPDYCMVPLNSTDMNNCGIPQSNDAWKNNLVFGGSGEGALLYVGQGTNAAATNYVGAGVVAAKPLIMPSLRLKHWRDGVQDYEYLNALTVAGQGTFVNTQVNNWITNTFTFDLTGNGLNTARFNVGQAIHALTFTGGGSSCASSPWANIIACTRAMDWSQVGVEGGIPSASWTQCGSTITPASAGADTAVINAALAGCAANHYVLLGPGTFTLGSNTFITMQPNVVLRGSGPDQTFLIMAGPQANGCGIFASVCFGGQNVSASSTAVQPGGVQSATWTAGYSAGTTQITVTNVGSTGIHAGQIVNLDQADDPMSVTAPSTSLGPTVCTQILVLNNSCSYDAPEGDGRGKGGGNVSNTPANWAARTGLVTVAGTTVTRAAGATWPSDGSWNSGGMILTLYPSSNGTGTAQVVTVATVGSTPFTTLTLTAPPSGGDGTYSFSAGAGMATISAGTTMTSTAGIPFVATLVGQSFYLMQNNVLYLVKASGFTNATTITLAGAPTPGNGNYAYYPSVHSQVQMVRVQTLDPACIPTAVCTGAGPFTLTLDRPLYAQNWNAAKGPGVWWATTTLEKSGIENLSIDHSAHSIQTSAAGMAFFNACNSWVKNVRSVKGIRNGVVFWGGCRNEVRDSYFVDVKNAQTQSYGVEFYRATDDLVQNNIFQHITTAIVPDITQGSVIANNFSIDNFVVYSPGGVPQNPTITATSQSGTTQTYTYTGVSALSGCSNFCPMSIAGTTNGGGVFNHNNVQYTFVDASHFTITVPTSATIGSQAESGLGLVSNSSMFPMAQMHGPGDMYNLYEGNIGASLYADGDHGPAFFNTFFRNYFPGCEMNKNSLSRIPFRIEATNGYFNVIGNILGSSAGCALQGSYQQTPSIAGTTPPIFYWEPVGQNSTAPIANTLPTQRSFASSMRWGNCDTISSPTCQFNSAEIPTVDAFGYANTVPGNTTLPISFWAGNTAPVYNQTPQGNVPWPFIGPDVAGGRAIAPDLAVPANMVPGGFAYNNAAEICYLNAPIDPAYPLEMDRGMLLFNGTNCYAAAAVSPTVTLGPGLLAYGGQNINTTSNPQTATLTNTGSVPVVVSAVTITGNFTRTGGTCVGSSFTLAVGANCTFIVTFSPTATIAYTGTLKVTDNASTGGGIQTVNLTGQGTVPIITWVSPQGGTTYTFGNVAVGTPVNSANLTLSNTGSGPLNVSLSLSNTVQFALFSNGCPNPLAAGSSCPVVVTFTPTAATSYTGNLIETDSVQSLTANMTLNGSGFIPVPNLVAPWPAIIIGHEGVGNEIPVGSYSALLRAMLDSTNTTSSRIVVEPYTGSDGIQRVPND
jgi:hypothetical protein